jgi:CheY-like chemotaxis protein
LSATVLIAEDNDELRTLLCMLLTRLGYRAIEASNGLEAIDQAVKTHPDLIIMDLLMPQLGGLEATKRLKENLATRDIPIVISTALSMDVLGHRKLLDSAQEVILKPVRLEKIKEIVRKYVPDEKSNATDVVDA